MLIRIVTNELIEYPDELGALVMADVNQGEVPPFSPEEVNLFVNGILGLLYDKALTLEENINHAKAHCAEWGAPDAAAMQKGFEQIKHYNESIPAEQIGYSSPELIDLYYLTEPKRKAKPYTIDQNLSEVGVPSALVKASLPRRE